MMVELSMGNQKIHRNSLGTPEKKKFVCAITFIFKHLFPRVGSFPRPIGHMLHGYLERYLYTFSCHLKRKTVFSQISLFLITPKHWWGLEWKFKRMVECLRWPLWSKTRSFNLKEKVSTFLFGYRYRSELFKVFMARRIKTEIGPW